MQLTIDRNVSILAVVFTAVLILISVRVSGFILPERFYFSISSVFKADDSLMLVDFPGVTGRRFCELAARHRIEPEDIGFPKYACDQVGVNDQYKSWGEQLGSKDREKIYEAWYLNRSNITRIIKSSLSNPITKAEAYKAVSNIALEGDTVNKAFRDYREGIQNRLGFVLNDDLGQEFTEIFAPLTADLTSVTDSEVHDDAIQFRGIDLKMNSDKRALISRQAAASILSVLNDESLGRSLKHPSIAEMDMAIDATYSPAGLASSILGTYESQLLDEAIDISKTTLIANDIPVSQIDEGVESVKIGFIIGNLPSYIAAAGIRALFVFLAVFVSSMILLDRADVYTFGIAASLAAFMLTWPVISLWDWVVRSEWQGEKYKFLIIYAVYILAFYYTGKSAALVGKMARNKYRLPIFAAEFDAERGISVSLREILSNVGIAVSLQAVAYFFSVLVPINAPS